MISFHKDLMNAYYVQCTESSTKHSKEDIHLIGKEMCREIHGKHNRGKNSLGVMKYSLIEEVAFEVGSWRMSRISIERYRSKGHSSGRSQNSKGRKLNGVFRE